MQVGSPWAHPHQPNHDKCVPTTTPFESLWVFSHLKKVPSFHIGGHCSLLTLWRELGRELSLSNERVIFHPQYILTTVTGRAILLDASVGSHCDVWKSQTPLQREREREIWMLFFLHPLLLGYGNPQFIQHGYRNQIMPVVCLSHIF